MLFFIYTNTNIGIIIWSFVLIKYRCYWSAQIILLLYFNQILILLDSSNPINSTIFKIKIFRYHALFSLVSGEWGWELQEFVFLFPSWSHCLPLGKELHSVLSIKVQVSIKRLLVSCEWEHWQWYWNWNIDTHLTCLNFVLELSGSWTWFCENWCSITPSVSVDEINRFLKGVCVAADQDGAENLLLVNCHIWSHSINNCWGYKVSLWELWVSVLATVKNDFGAFLFSSADQTNNSFLKFWITDWG